MSATFWGHEREDGFVGIRNYVAVIPTVFCANEVAQEIAAMDPICRPILHNRGCGQLKPDIEVITRTLVGLAANPNVGAALFVSLGCEAVSLDEVLCRTTELKKPAMTVHIQRCGGMEKAVRAGKAAAANFIERLKALKRKEFPVSRIRLAVKCGSSDATSGVSSNPATGWAVDRLVENGATVIFGETTEYIGAEHILARRVSNGQARAKLLEIVSRMERRVIGMGVDMRGTQPSPGNIAGGLTTIEEKSLGAISKSGTKEIAGVHEYASRIHEPGLHIMDSPGKEDEFLTGVAAAGANICVFTTSGGAPQGFALMPVIKVAGNREMVKCMAPHIDIDAGGIVSGEKSIGDVGSEIIEKILAVASGERSAAERLGYDKSIGIFTTGPTI